MPPLEPFDRDAYLARIGHHGAPVPDLDTLRRLHVAHLGRIPFENIDVRLGRPVSLDLAALQLKLVAAHRGGYCFEQNTLLGAGLEEKARAKERVFSVRDDFGQWNARNQRPELFDILNGRIHKGENVRAFPISNWTELDVWNYIKSENIKLPSVYFAHKRKVFLRDGLIWSDSPYINRDADEEVFEIVVRFRTVGDMTCTAAVDSQAFELDDVIAEIKQQRYQSAVRVLMISDLKQPWKNENQWGTFRGFSS